MVSGLDIVPELSVVIFATNADPDTPGAVQSVLDQDIPCEIIVVNSNGGDMAGLLTAYADRITIIEHAELLYAGGARNLGIAATTCPYIAFLACDCRAAKGWARYRLARHRDGAGAVASSVMHDRPWNLVAWADHLVFFPRRLPHLPRQLAIKYSVSYSRAALDRHGRFDETMRIGEDTEYNARFAPGERPVWTPEVVTIHRNNTSLPGMIRHQYQRGKRSGIQAWRLRGVTPLHLARQVLVAATQVPSLSWKGLRGQHRMMAIAALPLFAVALVSKLLGVLSADVKNLQAGNSVFTRSPSANIWRRLRREPKIIAAFSFRYDAHLVPGLITNLTPLVDGWVSYDDRNSGELYSNELLRQADLIATARRHGADWILAIDPDERLENGARRKLVLLARKGRYAWNLRLRELFAADFYRTDGIWGNKRVPRFFPAFSPPLRRHQSLHDWWFPKDRFKTRRCNINIYHLKMIAPVRRLGRRDLYKHLDPGNLFQQAGYDYLADEQGLTLEEIPKHRRYSPVHVDDGGLWMPEPPANGVNGGQNRGMVAKKAAEPLSL